MIIAIVLTFLKLPFYVTQPGMATELKPMVEVEDGFHEQGTFRLTTVRIGRANPFTYIWAKTQKYYDIFPIEDVKYEGETDEQYMERQIHMMEVSQQAAIKVAYERANKPIRMKYNGIIVMQVLEKMPAFDVLKMGDRIKGVNGQEIQTADEFIEMVKHKKAGDTLTLSIERDGHELTKTIEVVPFPDQQDKVGVGISLITDRELETSPDIILNTEDIGGPSAGLMMTLEIYNQLTEEDMTKGYKIAGTGTINEEGAVGPIGGIAQKIVAADKAGVDIFFAPNENGAKNSNYEVAVHTAKDIDTNMKIVPVDSFDDAIQFLETQ